MALYVYGRYAIARVYGDHVVGVEPKSLRGDLNKLVRDYVQGLPTGPRQYDPISGRVTGRVASQGELHVSKWCRRMKEWSIEEGRERERI